MRDLLAVIAAAIVPCAVLVLAGCGQKGPLYLPEKGAAVVTAPAEGPPPAPTPAAQPSEPSPAPQPQSATEPLPSGAAPPPKKPGTDEEQNPK
jgi:predicted small lipoprotein YifL